VLNDRLRSAGPSLQDSGVWKLAQADADQNHSEGQIGRSYHFRKDGKITQVSAIS
jgi:hypothetical protein